MSIRLSSVDHIFRSTAALTSGAGNANSGNISLWFNPTAANSIGVPSRIFNVGTGANSYLSVNYTVDGYVSFVCKNSSGTTLIDVRTNAVASPGTWHHILIGWDLSAPAYAKIALDGVYSNTVTTLTTGTVPLSGHYLSVGGSMGTGTEADQGLFRGEINQIWYDKFRSYVMDPAYAPHVQFFRTTLGEKTVLGANGAVESDAPSIYMNGANGNFGTTILGELGLTLASTTTVPASTTMPPSADNDPDPVSFSYWVDVEPASVIESNIVTISGIEKAATVTVSGGGNPQISINGGSWVSTGSITNGQTLRLRHTSSSSFLTTITSFVSIGSYGYNTTFQTKTRAIDTTPDAFSFPAKFAQTPNTVVDFGPVTITGMETAAIVTLSGDADGAYFSINGGSWVTSGNISSGQTLSVRHTTPATYEATRFTTVTVGSVSATCTSSTRVQDTLPDAFSFQAKTGQGIATVIESEVITPVGYTDTASVTITGSNNPQVSVGGGAWITPPTTISPGQTLKLRIMSSSSGTTTTSATVNVGGRTATFSVTTGVYDAIPDVFTIPSLTGQEFGVLVESAWVTPVGYTVPFTLSRVLEYNGQITKNGTTWANSLSIAPGESFKVRHTTSLASLDTTTTRLTYNNGTEVSFVTVNRVKDTAPDAFSFTEATDVVLAAIQEFGPITPVGYTDPAAVTVSGAGDPEFSINNGPWVTTGTITPGQSIRVRHLSSELTTTTVTSVLTIGGVSGNFVSTTAADTIPDTITFPVVNEVNRNTLTTSKTITVTGFAVPLPITITGDGNPQVRVNNGVWSSTGTINVGGKLAVRLTTGDQNSATYSATVKVGNGEAIFTVNTAEFDSILLNSEQDYTTNQPLVVGFGSEPMPVAIYVEPLTATLSLDSGGSTSGLFRTRAYGDGVSIWTQNNSELRFTGTLNEVNSFLTDLHYIPNTTDESITYIVDVRDAFGKRKGYGNVILNRKALVQVTPPKPLPPSWQSTPAVEISYVVDEVTRINTGAKLTFGSLSMLNLTISLKTLAGVAVSGAKHQLFYGSVGNSRISYSTANTAIRIYGTERDIEALLANITYRNINNTETVKLVFSVTDGITTFEGETRLVAVVESP